MIACDGQCCRITGAVTMGTAGSVLAELQPHLEQGIEVLDFSGVESADSSALAVIFSAMRQSQETGRPLACTGLPDSLLTLAELYGVADLLPA